jgi:hypothetical protein
VIDTASLFATAQSLNAQAYVLGDPAQVKDLPGALLFESGRAICLLDGGADVEAVAPHLICIDAANYQRAGEWLNQHAARAPCATVLISPASLEALASHLRSFVDVMLPDRTIMALAFWDPHILAVLNGARGDDTLHVRGPVFVPAQTHAFLAPILQWWYWDRNGRLQQLNGGADSVPEPVPSIKTPLLLDQHQVDALVEASVPDNILHFIRLNMPGLLLRVPEPEQYPFVRLQIVRARLYNIEGTGDLVNYCCLALAYGGSFDKQPDVAILLEQVKARVLTFDNLMNEFPRDIPEVDNPLPIHPVTE